MSRNTHVGIGGDVSVPDIPPVPEGTARPLWSVMIPTYNCSAYLPETLRSVLAQDPGLDKMQIEVVDDCSTADDPERVVRDIGNGRVGFYRKTANAGATANFNTCIERSVGQFVHILHGDDIVMDGYYSEVSSLAHKFPEAGLYATRSFFVDEKLDIEGVTRRICELEVFGESAMPFYYATPLQFAGVTVRRAAYEALGGFDSRYNHIADCEMWARIVRAMGGVVSPKVLSAYRIFRGNDSSRLERTGDNVREICLLNRTFSQRYPDFSQVTGQRRAADLAWRQVRKFHEQGDSEAVEANLRLWAELTPIARRLAVRLMTAAPALRRYVG